MSVHKILIPITIAFGLVAAPASTHPAPPATFVSTTNPYAPYEFLIGDWYSTPAGTGTTIHEQLRWGPKQAYIFYSTYLAESGKPEELHFEGIVVWNGKTKVLDYLFTLQPGSGFQEKGTIRAEADGSVVREVESTSPKGQVTHFRQTFRKTGPDTAVTSLFRQTDKGWEPNFPGSEQIVMSRRPG